MEQECREEREISRSCQLRIRKPVFDEADRNAAYLCDGSLIGDGGIGIGNVSDCGSKEIGPENLRCLHHPDGGSVDGSFDKAIAGGGFQGIDGSSGGDSGTESPGGCQAITNQLLRQAGACGVVDKDQAGIWGAGPNSDSNGCQTSRSARNGWHKFRKVVFGFQVCNGFEEFRTSNDDDFIDFGSKLKGLQRVGKNDVLSEGQERLRDVRLHPGAGACRYDDG